MTHRATYRHLVVAVLAAICLAALAYGQDDELREAVKVFSSDKAEAERLLRPIVAREPDNRVARYFLGGALFYQKKYEAAIEVYEPLVAEELEDPQLAGLLRNPEPPLALLDNLAMAYGLTGNYEKCSATLQAGISLAPDYPYFYVNRGCFFAEMGGREDEALQSTELGLRKAMKTGILGRILGWVGEDDSLVKLSRQDDLKQLIQHYTFPRRTLTQEPPDRVVLALNYERLKVTLQLLEFAHWKTRNEANPKLVLAVETDKGNILLTLFCAWVGPGTTPQLCRKYFFGTPGAPSPEEIVSAKVEDHPSYALAIMDATMPDGPPDLRWRDYHAYYVSGEYCLDLHLSTAKLTEARDAKMRAIIESVSIEPLPPHPTLFPKEEPLAKPAAGPVP